MTTENIENAGMTLDKEMTTLNIDKCWYDVCTDKETHFFLHDNNACEIVRGNVMSRDEEKVT